jgi:regulator of protease activity HflC (stomatin/prohibitin superfamily)
MDIIITVLAVAGILAAIIIVIKAWWHTIVVDDGTVALLFHKGRFSEVLEPGLHRIWGRRLRWQVVSTRPALLNLSGQEVLTADNLVVKVSATASYKITNAEKAIRGAQNFLEQLYLAIHQGVRSVVAGKKLDDLLAQRATITKELLPLVEKTADDLGVRILAVHVKDFMLSGELKKAFADVVQARTEGQAALERARGEAAALRHLANAAQVFEHNPGLMKLRYLQTVEHACASGAGHTLMIGLTPEQTGVAVGKKPA